MLVEQIRSGSDPPAITSEILVPRRTAFGTVRRDLIVHAVHNPFCWLGVLIVIVSIIALVSGISTHGETRVIRTSAPAQLPCGNVQVPLWVIIQSSRLLDSTTPFFAQKDDLR